MESVPRAILACAVLHNLAVEMNLPDVENEEIPDGIDEVYGQPFEANLFLPPNQPEADVRSERQKMAEGKRRRIELTERFENILLDF